MKPVITVLEEKISAVMAAVSGQSGCSAMVRPATDAKFGDYQVNGVMPLAKQIKTDPRKLAEQVVAKLDISDICEKPEIAGPGFINLRLRAGYVAEAVLEANRDAERLGVEKTSKPETVVVDFSGPNIAKQMHVGHLRSTIIGDCICRMLELEGHKVIRQNHIGDWGTHFGMLVQHLHEQAFFKQQDENLKNISESVERFDISDSEQFYIEAKEEFDLDEEFRRQARQRVVELHEQSNKHTVHLWEHIVQESRKHYQPIYNYLSVLLNESHERGESFYKGMLPGIVEELLERKIAEKSEGAVCVFPEGFKNKEGEPLPFIIRKSDGAYLYATTDLAAIRYRVKELKADRIIYVTDARQKLHFEMLFEVAKMAGWAEDVELVHVTFGSVLGENGKPLKTREGENVKLKELLDEAVERAKKVVEEKNPELPAGKKAEIAKAVGIGAVKYADYSNNRESDYIFSFDKMLAMDGNTAPYMQYAYARVKSIVRRAPEKGVDVESERAKLDKLVLNEPAELDLAKQLIRYGEAIEAAAADYRPNYLTSYLYELAQKFSVFYTNCPVLDAGQDKRPTRLLLCDLTAETIGHGLKELLGIEVVEQM